jgi:hypothetical protein
MVELIHRLAPVDLALFDLVQFFFHASRVAHIEDIVEALQQQSVTTMPNSVGWKRPASFFTYSRS